jgi:hypothetical protein
MQGSGSVAIGFQAGQGSQGANAVAIGFQAGQTAQGSGSVSIGFGAGFVGQLFNAVAIGSQAGQTSQASSAVAIGVRAGLFGQGGYSVAIGDSAGRTSQASGAITIGFQSGGQIQGANAVAIGYQSAFTGQASGSIAIGFQASVVNQGVNSVALGVMAAQSGQASGCIAIGFQAGQTGQFNNSIAIGTLSAITGQGAAAIAIGLQAAQISQGAASIAIGALSVSTNANSIMLNATGLTKPTNASNGLFASPVRNSTVGSGFANVTNSAYLMYYDPVNGEMGYGGAITATATTLTKTFVIDHPTEPDDRYLVHGCLEGPEGGVYYRGSGRIVDGVSTTIELPQYVHALAADFTVQITPIYDEENGCMCPPLNVGRIRNGRYFTVYQDTAAQTNRAEFFWTVMGTRHRIDVEPRKSDTVVMGEGPYRWIPH